MTSLSSWRCWSCKEPVTLEQRADADGDCPHCGAELDLESWPLHDPLFHLQVSLLEWNRSQPVPPITQGYEYGVATAAIRILQDYVMSELDAKKTPNKKE